MRFFYYLLLLPIYLFSNISHEIITKMSLDEKIGQLFMIPISPKRDDIHKQDVIDLITKCHIGSLIVKQSDPKSQIECLNSLQKISKHPLLVAADAEWGLGMRMDNTISFPKNGYLENISNELIYELGKEIARELKLVGVHINLAPIVDVNTNPDNPIINIRAFSDDPNKVAEKAVSIIKGMQNNNILTCAKHFPGHGDTFLDSHKGLPTIIYDKNRLDEIELVPFKKVIQKGVDFIMVAHILFPAFSDMPATMSKEIVQDLLRNELDFKGLIISDALNMKALLNYYTVEEIAFYSHRAGIDILLYGDHINLNVDDILNNQIPKAFERIKKAYLSGELDIKNLDKRVLKILQAKEKLNLFDNRFVDDFDEKILNSDYAFELKEKLEKLSAE